MADPELVKIIRQGKGAVGCWRSSETSRLREKFGYDGADTKARFDRNEAAECSV